MGADGVTRIGAVRGAIQAHRASAVTQPMGPYAPPSAGCFCPVAVLAFSSDASASHIEACLATKQNHPGQMAPINPDTLYITEQADGTARLTYRKPSHVFGAYEVAELDRMAADLDRIFEKIVADALAGT